MGILSDFYVASNSEDARRYGVAPQTFLDRAEYKWFLPLQASMLWSALERRTWAPTMLDAFDCVMYECDGEMLIHCFPNELTNLLCMLDADSFVATSQRWLDAADCSLDGTTADDLVQVLEDLVRLARRATSTQGKLYLWNCL